MDSSHVRWIELPYVQDERGVLTAIEAAQDIPFAIRRVFFIHGTGAQRGGHAHLATTQLLVPVAGTFCVQVSDGTGWSTHHMDDPHRGLLLPPLTWVVMKDFSAESVCLVLADTHFADDVFIRDHGELAAMRERREALG
jgi:hypothetical protein